VSDYLFDFYRRTYGFAAGDLPQTEDAAARELTLPLYPTMTEEAVDYVSASLRQLLR